MKASFALPLLAGGLLAFHLPLDPTVEIWISGNQQGLLTPCGCSSPMVGGLPRMGSALRAGSHRERIVLDNGGWVAGRGRQDELKAETFAQALISMNVTAIHLSKTERTLGEGTMIAIQNLAGDRLVGDGKTIARGRYLIGGASNELEASRLATDAKSQSKIPILLLDGDLSAAEEAAKANPALALVAYHSGGRAQRSWVGKTLLVSPGDKGREIASLVLEGAKPIHFQPIELGEGYPNDPAIGRVHRTYLGRIESENLLGKLPHRQTAPYAGVSACKGCHSLAFRAWAKSDHAGSFQTLRRLGEDIDPDCVRCHVTGLESTSGFWTDRQPARVLHDPLGPGNAHAKNEFSFVGCESCHGPAGQHAMNPKAHPLQPAMGVCETCHTTEQSPHFRFQSYWRKIRH